MARKSTNIEVTPPLPCAPLRVLGYKQLLVVCDSVTHETVLGPRFYIMSVIVNLQLTATTANREHVNGVSFQAFAVLQWRSLFFLGVPLHYWATGARCFKTVWGCHLPGSSSPPFFFGSLTLENKVLCSFETSETTHSI